MQTFVISPSIEKRVVSRQGRLHPYDQFGGKKTALLAIDMQNYFVAPGYQSEVPAARTIVPNINRLGAAVRQAGGRVIWVQTASDGADELWSHHRRSAPARTRAGREHRKRQDNAFRPIPLPCIAGHRLRLTPDPPSLKLRRASMQARHSLGDGGRPSPFQGEGAPPALHEIRLGNHEFTVPVDPSVCISRSTSCPATTTGEGQSA